MQRWWDVLGASRCYDAVVHLYLLLEYALFLMLYYARQMDEIDIRGPNPRM